MPWSRSPIVSRRAQATVEMAVILPLLATLTMAVLEFGLLLQSYILVVNLGREGARVAVDGATNCEIRSVLSIEGNQRIRGYATNAAVLIVRGYTSKNGVADTVGWVNPSDANAWSVDPANPPGWTLQAQRGDVRGLTLDSSAGFNFVLVEVQYIHETITRLPFAQNVPLTTRAIIRTPATNTHLPLPPCPS